MKNLFLLLALVLSTALSMQGQSVDHEKAISELLDAWHLAAAEGDFDGYFGLMADDAMFLGTDKTERWTKSEFQEFAKPHFEDGKAWAFTSTTKYVYFNEEQNLAWFDELLDTWMGTCRGSGVLVLTQDGWKIQQYNLTLTIDNDKMKEVIEVCGEG